MQGTLRTTRVVIDFSLVLTALCPSHHDIELTHLQNLQVARTLNSVQNIADIKLTEDLIARRKDRLEQKLFMFDLASLIVPILGNYDLPKTLQAR